MAGAREAASERVRTAIGASIGIRTRGYLFADLRGYSHYVEHAGANAGVALLERYRELVREQVARYHGAEIRTEGDSFYVVLNSASVAVQCALDIVAAARHAGERSWAAPIKVGVGVHAGEAIDTPEGPVGTSVNIAARLCALAPADQVLVSDTVRALTRSTLPVRYARRGRRRLKGITESVEVFRVLSADEPDQRSSGGLWARWLAVILVLVALLLAAAVAVGLIGLSTLK